MSFTCLFDSNVIKCQFNDAFLFSEVLNVDYLKNRMSFSLFSALEMYETYATECLNWNLCPSHPYFLKFSFPIKLRAIQSAENWRNIGAYKGKLFLSLSQTIKSFFSQKKRLRFQFIFLGSQCILMKKNYLGWVLFHRAGISESFLVNWMHGKESSSLYISPL